MRGVVLLVLLAWCRVAQAAQGCATIDTTGWTPRQVAWREAIAYRLAFDAGQNVMPTITGDTICFTDTTFDVPTIITATTLLNKMAQQEAQHASEAAQVTADQQELDTLTTALATDDAAWTTLTTAQKLAVMKKLLRREVLRRRLGQ